MPMSLGSAEATVPGPSQLGTRSAWWRISCGLVWPTVLSVVWVFHDQGCSVGGTILPSPHWGGSSLASPIPFPFVSSVTMYSPGPTPNIHSGSSCTSTISRSSGEALTGGVPGSLTLFLNCMGNPNVSLNWPSQSYIWFSSRVGVGCLVVISFTACTALCHSSACRSSGVGVLLTGAIS